ncbi:hypothetical protein yc1106_02132 [Curvularia clavata]|uniref:Alcohol dehydrogenase-like N-terminal domain-containing protein n=1 Tax=Curvularia clavata TaxID=95742 RepID=A0A9Q9DP81_CURCL|nr:hypothetical protein yc1106_02132 [Curvularia clavata]
MDALVLHPTEYTAVRETVPVPTPGQVELLVQVEAVALNPVDSLYVRHPLANSKRTIGSDFAGLVASLGKDVPAISNLQVGDRVAGFLQGACSVNVRPGAFAKYLVVPWDLVWKIPKGYPIEKAAGFVTYATEPLDLPYAMTSTSLAQTHERKINTSAFYREWKGHDVTYLERFRNITHHQRPDKAIVYLAGDSSLDNKYWVIGSGPGGDPLGVNVPEIYMHTLDRPTPKPDVAFWVNHMLGSKATCINAAVEESMLRERDNGLLPQDQFIHDSICENDILIVSIGANDIAMRPTFSTTCHMVKLAWLTWQSSIVSGTAWSLPYFASLFHTATQRYIERLTAKTKPRAVIVCMIYFPLEKRFGQSGWADLQLRLLGYEKTPRKLQTAIRQMFEMGTKNISITGVEVVPCALYEVMDGTKIEEFTARVEPSKEGGRKMALKFVELVEGILGNQ